MKRFYQFPATFVYSRRQQKPRPRHSLRRHGWLHAMVLFAFTLQAIVPVGFMPAAVSSGQLIKLCPTGLSPELMSILHPQHQFQGSGHLHHGSHHSQSQPSHEEMQHEQWRADCPFGAVASSDLLLQSWPRLRLSDAYCRHSPLFYSKPLFAYQHPSTRHARAPPSTTS
ncbi:MAG: hypothetical protein AAF542_19535 [Pseudomonadota bacterium]